QLLKKFLPPLMADLVESARKFGRDEYLVQAMCNDTVELWLIHEKGSGTPGRVMCIDAEEYERIFGEPPVRGLPRVPAFSPNRPAETTPPAPGTPRTSRASDAPTVPAEQQYKPASPALEELARDVDRQMDKRGGAPATRRP